MSWKPLPLSELLEMNLRLEAQGLLLPIEHTHDKIDPRPILVDWKDMPLSFVGPNGLDWERVKDIYTSKQEDDDDGTR